MLGRFAIPSTRGSCFVRTLHYDPCILGGPTQHDSWLHWVLQAPLPWQGSVHEGAGRPGVLQSTGSQRVRQLGEWKTKMTSTTITKLYITSQEFASLMTESLYRLTDIYLCPPTPKPMATTILLSTSVSFMFSDATYKWDHKVFVFVWLISLSIMSSRLIHVITSGRIPLIFWLNNIPLYLHITFSLSILPLMDFRLFQYLGYCEKCYFPRGRREEHEI